MCRLEPDVLAHLEAEYVSSSISLVQLAAKHGVSYRAVRQASRANDWVKKREQTVHRIAASAIDQIEKRRAAAIAGMMDLSDKSLAILGRLSAMYDDDEAVKLLAGDTAQARALVAALVDLGRLQRESYSIPTVREAIDRERLEIERERLRMEKEQREAESGDSGVDFVVHAPDEDGELDG